jgi:2-phosphosulfolactate phosphatase
MMKIHRATLEDCGKETDTVVVIDVLRAFTTSAYAFAEGVSDIALVSSVEDAFNLRKRFPDALILGEVDGYPVEGFDLGNSPSVLIGSDLSGKRLIQRTTAGTQGVIRSSQASNILATGLCSVSATVRKVLNLSPISITLVQTGVFPGGWGDEDIACADLIEAQVYGTDLNIEKIKQRVRESRSGVHYSDPDHSVFPSADLDAALEIDRFDFAMSVDKEDGVLFLRPD